jgi:aspartate oxidase
MWEHAGIERSGAGLALALAATQAWPNKKLEPTRASHEQREMAVLARLMLEAASRRTESRGAHFRSDFPLPDDERWLRHQVFRRAG